MTHTLTPNFQISDSFRHEISVFEITDDVNISIAKVSMYDNVEDQILSLNLDKKELRDFIGLLLHVQSRLNK